MAFAEPTDVATAYEGLSPALPSDAALIARIATVSARLRLLLPDLEDRITADESGDLALLTKDVVVQAVIRRLPGRDREASSQTQQAGPFSTTVRYTTDRSGIFSDEDLDLLRGVSAQAAIGTIGTVHIGRPNWSEQL